MPKDLVRILPDYDERLGHMNVSLSSVRDAELGSYARFMAETLAMAEAQREENRRIQEIRKKKGIDPHAQAPSTQAILARPKEKDEEHFFRPLVKCQILDQDGNPDIGERPVTIQEINLVEAVRRRPKNSIGQSARSAFDESAKERAVHALICSPGTNLSEKDATRIAKPIPYETPQMVAVWSPMTEHTHKQRTLASRFFHWLWKRSVPIDKLVRKDFKVEEADKT